MYAQRYPQALVWIHGLLSPEKRILPDALNIVVVKNLDFPISVQTVTNLSFDQNTILRLHYPRKKLSSARQRRQIPIYFVSWRQSSHANQSYCLLALYTINNYVRSSSIFSPTLHQQRNASGTVPVPKTSLYLQPYLLRQN